MLFKQLLTVFKKPRYSFLAAVIALVVFTAAVWLPNLSLIGTVLTTSSATFFDKLSFLLSLYWAIGSNFTLFSAIYTVAIAILFGINLTLLIYYIRRVSGGVRGMKVTGAAGIGGLVSGIFGIGCAACGTFILTSVLTLFGATGFLALLPLQGEEFGILGVVLLMYSIYLLLKKIGDPLVCEIN